MLSGLAVTSDINNLHNLPSGRFFKPQKMAEARGFEPPVRLPAHTLSKRAP